MARSSRWLAPQVFPSSEVKMSGPEWSDCAKKGLAVKAFRGDAVMFYRCVCPGTNLADGSP